MDYNSLAGVELLLSHNLILIEILEVGKSFSRNHAPPYSCLVNGHFCILCDIFLMRLVFSVSRTYGIDALLNTKLILYGPCNNVTTFEIVL